MDDDMTEHELLTKLENAIFEELEKQGGYRDDYKVWFGEDDEYCVDVAELSQHLIREGLVK